MSNFVIIGSGLLGNELGKIIEKKGDNVKIIKNVKYGQEVIPNGSDVVIITAQSADYKEREMTSDLLFVNDFFSRSSIIWLSSTFIYA